MTDFSTVFLFLMKAINSSKDKNNQVIPHYSKSKKDRSFWFSDEVVEMYN